MFSIQLTTSLERLAPILSQYHNDVAWLDSPDSQGLSILAFGASETQTFLQSTPVNAFESFFKKFSFAATQNTKKTGLELSPLWLGYFSYEAFLFNPLIPFQPQSVKPYPLGVWRRYQSYIICQNEVVSFVSFATNAETIYQTLLQQIANTPPASPLLKKNQRGRDPSFSLPSCLTSWPDYQAAFAQIQASLKGGDYFELNHTIEFAATQTLDSENLVQLYLALRQTAQAPMMAFLSWPELKVLSASPELFFKISTDGSIRTEPIKGTLARGSTADEDLVQESKLLASSKDRAELLMITDLLRSDLGRVCEVGTITTDKVLVLKTFSHYHHLVSEISGQLRPDCSFFDVFCALFPGGSITGAPKIQVMRAIQDLENRPRGLYTGALGVLSECGWAQFSIPIRTLTQTEDKMEFATGGGIVVDSVVDAEYEECFVKAKTIMETLKKFFAVSLCFVLLMGCAKTPVENSGDFETEFDDNTILIRDYTFFPEEISAEAGQILTIYNDDAVPHEILSESAFNAFDDTGDFSSGVINSAEFGFITVPEDANEGDEFFLYCNIMQDLMTTPNAQITVIATE